MAGSDGSRARATRVAGRVVLLALAVSGIWEAGAARAAAGPQTFGPNLAQLSDSNQYDCSADPFLNGVPTNPVAPSCTWTSSDPLNPLGGQFPPSGLGTITQVMIKVGAITGPMQVVIMRAEFQPVAQPEFHYAISCCVDVGQTAPFTPAANAITTEPVNLPVEVDSAPNPDNGLYTVDLVGLSVLEDGVPVPAVDERGLPIDSQPALDVEQPAMQDNGVVELAADGDGFLVAMDSVWVPQSSAPTPTPTPTPTPHPALLPALSFPTKGTLAKVSGGNALVDLDCAAGGAACSGTVNVQSAKAALGAADAARKAKITTYATGTFALAAGKTKAVKAGLSNAGRAAARQHRKLTVWLNVTFGGSSRKVVSHRVTIRF